MRDLETVCATGSQEDSFRILFSCFPANYLLLDLSTWASSHTDEPELVPLCLSWALIPFSSQFQGEVALDVPMLVLRGSELGFPLSLGTLRARGTPLVEVSSMSICDYFLPSSILLPFLPFFISCETSSIWLREVNPLYSQKVSTDPMQEGALGVEGAGIGKDPKSPNKTSSKAGQNHWRIRKTLSCRISGPEQS